MINSRKLAMGILCTVLGASLLYAEDFSSYRGLQFGMKLSVATKQAGRKPSDVRSIHERPAVIQELDWQPQLPFLADPVKADPVKDGVLCFYNGELFRIVVTYDRYRVEGMTPEDMIDAISATYGIASRHAGAIPYHSIYGDVAEVIARWEDSEYSYNLVRTGNQSSFSMVLYSKRQDALAEAAIVEAVRLDAQEAPQREIEVQKKKREEDGLALEKARSANKPNFRP